MVSRKPQSANSVLTPTPANAARKQCDVPIIEQPQPDAKQKHYVPRNYRSDPESFWEPAPAELAGSREGFRTPEELMSCVDDWLDRLKSTCVHLLKDFNAQSITPDQMKKMGHAQHCLIESIDNMEGFLENLIENSQGNDIRFRINEFVHHAKMNRTGKVVKLNDDWIVLADCSFRWRVPQAEWDDLELLQENDNRVRLQRQAIEMDGEGTPFDEVSESVFDCSHALMAHMSQCNIEEAHAKKVQPIIKKLNRLQKDLADWNDKVHERWEAGLYPENPQPWKDAQ